MAFAHHEVRPDHVRVRAGARGAGRTFGETAHYAVLDGREVVYRAKVDPSVGAVRLTSTIGGRNFAHATGVGKLLLAYRLPTREDVANWVGGEGLVRRTPHTRCTIDDLHRDLKRLGNAASRPMTKRMRSVSTAWPYRSTPRHQALRPVR